MKQQDMAGNFFLYVVILLLAFSLLNIYFLFQRGEQWKNAQTELEEQLRPASLQVVILTVSNCDFCYNASKALLELQKQNVNLTLQETIPADSAVGKEIIAKYGITKLPTILVSGELNHTQQLQSYFTQHGEYRDGRFVFTALTPPYFSVSAKNVAGLVSIFTIKDPNCAQCGDLSTLPSSLEQQGVFIKSKKEITYDSPEGKELISRFGLEVVPSLLISQDILEYPELSAGLANSARLRYGYYIIPAPAAPYRDLNTNSLKGLVTVYYLNDSSCQTCYDVLINRNILRQFGVAFKEEKVRDVKQQEAKTLLQKYNITKVPVLLLSPDAAVYPTLVNAWKSVGTVEEDGWFVMRKTELLGTYRDLLTNQEVTPGAAH